ncbi:ABC transporter ATP-binding protein [Aureimonas leprariae]|uniref:ABC transporter ATP-binding protein n=1 Tax=Plantimonas leprariae TaxID=2615207 RepID=A0A7V7TWP2_9HYPH|nr:ABC transporter ATP-binding protein [Aureimonas leprariae]KAB0680218.1 ABC transporter ATP-binding protein [Aureimonas leprariae]
MSFLILKSVRKSFGPHTVVHDFDLAIERGEFVTFLGPSGCGKTTLLRMVAGFEAPTAGTITVDGRDVTHLPPNARKVGMVFQAYALFPNMTVADNVAFGLKVAGRPKEEIRSRVEEMLALIKLGHLGGRYPYQLSGGQQQRVALARALAVRPQLLLLDEPLSALDAKIRLSLRQEIRDLQRKLGITAIFVTHDQEEALSISDRIVVLNEGRAEQVGTPFEIYNHPRTRFAASFIGTLSLLEGEAAGEGRMRVEGQEIRVPANGNAPGRPLTLALRPEALSLHPVAAKENRLEGTIEEVDFLGSVVRMRVRVGGTTLLMDNFNDPATPPPARGEKVTLHFAPADGQLLDQPLAEAAE